MSNDELQQLKALAEAATPNWFEDKWGALMVSEHEPMYMRGATIAGAGSRVEQAKKNTSFIAAANPAVILALIAKVESLEADAARLDFVIDKGAFITWSLRDSTIKQCQLMNQDEDEDFHYLSGDDKYFNTVRDAIDAAKAKEKA
jgi:hypothetical protein